MSVEELEGLDRRCDPVRVRAEVPRRKRVLDEAVVDLRQMDVVGLGADGAEDGADGPDAVADAHDRDDVPVLEVAVLRG